jgi:hypothetical protein
MLDAFQGTVAAPQADTAAKYDSYVRRVFGHLKYRQVGRLIIESIDEAGHAVTIYPHPNQIDAVTNAEIEPVTRRRLPRARVYNAAAKTCSPPLSGGATTILFPPEASLRGDSQVGWDLSSGAWQLVRASRTVPAIREHGDGGGRGVDAAAALGRRHGLHPRFELPIMGTVSRTPVQALIPRGDSYTVPGSAGHHLTAR